MIETVSESFAGRMFDVVSILIAIAALVYAALAFKAAKQAIQATKDSDLTALRVKIHDEILEAERIFLSLQQECQMTRTQWVAHFDAHYPPFGRGFANSKELREVSEVESEGREILQKLHTSACTAERVRTSELEDFVRTAQFASIEIARLKFRLEKPKPLRR